MYSVFWNRQTGQFSARPDPRHGIYETQSEAEEWIATHINPLLEQGMSPNQAIRSALSHPRNKGQVPEVER